jgi:aspartyl-tRNA(Asn)/glutamyl-tRNA(Gln) amidotransferase subunit B
MLNTGKTVHNIIKEKNLVQISDEGEIIKIIEEVIKNNPTQVDQFKAGKDPVIMYLVGQVMKASKGRAKPDAVQSLLRKALS